MLKKLFHRLFIALIIITCTLTTVIVTFFITFDISSYIYIKYTVGEENYVPGDLGEAMHATLQGIAFSMLAIILSLFFFTWFFIFRKK